MEDSKYQALQDIGKGAAESIAELVAALECDYDRLEELREELKEVTASDRDDLGEERTDVDTWMFENGKELAELETAAGECESRDDAEERIQEDPLSVQVRSGWYSPGATADSCAEEFEILLGTGGPATRIIGELANGQPSRARLQAQDWGTSWTDYTGDALSDDDLLTYCRCFYFGE